MTSRECPWCGGNNLHIFNVIGTTETVYWEDRDCGYREQTGYGPEYPVKKRIEPRPKKADYVVPAVLPETQTTLSEI